jgi:hypothetical protein
MWDLKTGVEAAAPPVPVPPGLASDDSGAVKPHACRAVGQDNGEFSGFGA